MSQSNLPGEPRLHHANIIQVQNQNLVRQNVFLIDEINKLRAAQTNAVSSAVLQGDSSATSLEVLGFFTRARRLLHDVRTRLLALPSPANPKHQAASDFLTTVLQGLVGVLSSQGEGVESGAGSGFDRALTLSIDKLTHALLEPSSTGETEAAVELARLRGRVGELEESLKTPPDFQAKLDQLEGQLESLKWRNHILEKRISFGQNALLQHSQTALEAYVELPDVYCYCGGKFLTQLFQSAEALATSSQGGFLESISRYLAETSLPPPGQLPQSPGEPASKKDAALKEPSALERQIISLGRVVSEQPLFSKQASQMPEAMEIECPPTETPADGSAEALVKVYAVQVAELQKSNQQLIELGENKRIDRLAGVKNLTQTNLFKRILEENELNLKTIQTLEARLAEMVFLLNDIEELRRKETSELREKHLRDKERFAEDSANFRLQIAELQKKNDLFSVHFDPKSGHFNKAPDAAAASADPNVLLTKVYQAIKTIIAKQNLSIQTRDKRIKDLETLVEELKAHGGVLPNPLPPAPLKHTQHEETLNKVALMVPPGMAAPLAEVHKYLKSREEKIRLMAKELQSEKGTSESLLSEIANSCTVYQNLKQEFDVCKGELEAATKNFNLVYKEKQTEKAQMSQRIAELEALHTQSTEKAASRLLKVEACVKDLKETDLNLRTQLLRTKEALQQVEALTREKGEMTGQLALLEGEREQLEVRVEAMEVSQKKLSVELAESLTEVGRSKGIQKQLLELLEGKRLLPDIEGGAADEGDNSQAKGQSLIQQLEMKDLKVS